MRQRNRERERARASEKKKKRGIVDFASLIEYVVTSEVSFVPRIISTALYLALTQPHR